MKKTLITLAALATATVANAASADLLPDWAITNKGYNTNQMGNLADYAPSADLVKGWLGDADDGWYNTTANNDLYWGSGMTIDGQKHLTWSEAGYTTGTTMGLPEKEDIITMNGMNGVGGNVLGMKTTLDLTESLSSLQLSFTLGTTGSSTKTYSLWYEKNDGSVTNIVTTGASSGDVTITLTEAQLSDLNTNGTGEMYLIFGNKGDDTAIMSISNVSMTVPEPTTTTLSLLALAGLALRRRRKA